MDVSQSTSGAFPPVAGRLRSVAFVAALLFAGSSAACVTAKDQKQEQQELRRSIQTTSDPDVVRECSYIMNLRSNGRYATPEEQVASLVIPKADVVWVILQSPAGNQLYSCNASSLEPPAKAAVAAPAQKAESAPAQPPVAAPAAAEAPPANTSPTPAAALAQTNAEPVKASPGPRVTSNPEAVKGCKFLESFSTYRSVLRFQEDVVKAGGNVGLVVATNRDGDVIGESYSCVTEAKP
jgi:hypothetical protein